ncbi:MAG: HAD family phosphatase [Tissierellia bacterium]|nr:HAD family phosphatase [Tissierellia bacterium]
MKVFIFDMDGTFVDSMDYWNNLMLNYLESKDVTPEESLMTDIVSLTLHDGIEYTKDKYSLRESVDEILDEMRALIGYNYKNTFNLDPATIEIFRHLKKAEKKVVLATATERSLVDIVLDRFDLKKYLDLEIVSDEVNLHKNDPQYFLDIGKHFGASGEECSVIEDSLYAIKSANEAGMETVGIIAQTPPAHIEIIKELSVVSGNNLTEVKDYFLSR